MKKPQRERPFKDERDRQVDDKAKVCALEWVTAATQVLTVMCIIKGNPAWKGSLSLLFFGCAFGLFYKYSQYEERPYKQVGIALLAVGAALLVWFGISG